MSEHDQLIIDLEVVGQVRSSDKLGVHTLLGSTRLVVDSGSSYTQSVRRWYNSCDRDGSLDYLNGLVQRCQNTRTLILDGKLRHMGVALRGSTVRAIVGLGNLQSTYSSDSTTVARLGLCIAKLQDVVDELKCFSEDESHLPSSRTASPRPSN